MDILRKSESEYYASLIKNHAESSKMLWKTLGSIIKKTKTKHSTIEQLKIGNISTTDPKKNW